MSQGEKILGTTGRMAEYFIGSKLTPLIILMTLVIGCMAIMVTPKEDEPSIKVSVAQVFVAYPGRGAREIDERLARPMAAWIREITTVKHVISAASEDGLVLTVEFRDGVEREKVMIQLYDHLNANLTMLPPGASMPLVKSRSRDDVPSLAVNLWSSKADPQVLRKIAAEMAAELQRLPNVSRVDIIGGQPRAFLVEVDAGKLSERGIAADRVVQAIQAANLRLPAGKLSGPAGVYNLDAGSFIRTAEDAGLIIVGANSAGPVYLRDVAVVRDSPAEPASYVSRIGKDTGWSSTPSVTLAITKVDRSNVTEVTRQANLLLAKLGKELLPSDIRMSITRDNGLRASNTLHELSWHMFLAVGIAILLVAFALGWREGIVTAITLAVTLVSIPIIYSLTGFTLNRISLSAMVFAIGLLIDNAIVIIENIDRHWHTGQTKGMFLAALAVEEVGPPTILATIMVISALVPTAFVSGAIGQYLRPLPVGASLGMLFSLFVALSVTPYLYYRFLTTRRSQQKNATTGHVETARMSGLKAAYLRLLGWLMERHWRIYGVYAMAIILFAGVVALVPLRIAQVRSMPDNDADEISIMVDLPVHSQLEDTHATLTDVARRLKEIPEVTACNIYVGTSAPLTFQGLARSYDYRMEPYQAEIQVQILPEAQRHRSSHAIALALHDFVAPLLSAKDTFFAIAEVPAGNPNLASLVAEVYGPDEATRQALAGKIMGTFKSTPHVREVDWTARPGAPRLRYEVDPQKAGLRGVAAAQAAGTVRTLFAGDASAWASLPEEREPAPFMVRLARGQRIGEEDIRSLAFTSLLGGPPVPAGDIGSLERLPGTYPLLRKDMQPVIMVKGAVIGAGCTNTAKDISKILEKEQAGGRSVQVLWTEDNPDAGRYAVRWAGEWTDERDVFSDLGKSFAVVIFLIYCLLVGWYRSFLIPIVIMLPIPLIFIGVIPAHVILGQAMSGPATIAVIGLAGVVIRNSILLVDFARTRIAEGMPIREAVLKACEMRSRPIILTALAVILGEAVLYFDTVLIGMGITLPSGALVSTLLTLGIVPLAYYQLDSFLHRHGAALEQHDAETEMEI